MTRPRIRPLLAALLLAFPAAAQCVKPQEPAGASEAALRDYLAQLDGYAGCVKADALRLPPLQRFHVMQDYDAVFADMQRAVDSYNAAHQIGS